MIANVVRYVVATILLGIGGLFLLADRAFNHITIDRTA
jgi:hypothetical protein